MWAELAGVQGVRYRSQSDQSDQLPSQLIDIVQELESIEVRLTETTELSAGSSATSDLTEASVLLRTAAQAITRSVDYQCTLADPPETIRGRPTGSNNNMVHECFHQEPHCWDGVWNSISCPSA